jgi:hypothetical protein
MAGHRGRDLHRGPMARGHGSGAVTQERGDRGWAVGDDGIGPSSWRIECPFELV